MKKKILVFFLILLFLINPLGNTYTTGASLESNYINIKLSRPIKNKTSIGLRSKEGFSIYNKDNLFREVEYLDTDYLNISLLNGDIIISDGYGNLLPMENYKDMVIGSSNVDNNEIKVEDNFYRGYIFFKTNGKELIPINYLSLEDYLYGVIAREMPASFNMEALKAQAVASRTYTLHNINKHRSEGYNLCDTTHCQVYGGIGGEHERTNRAVDETYGMVIEYNGQIIDAVYHANSGGHTRDSQEAWGGYLPYLIGVKDRYSEGVASSTWSFSISPFELFKNLSDNKIDIGFPLGIEIVERTPANRVKKMKIIGQYGEEILSESLYKRIFGANNFRTTWFSIRRETGTVEKSFYAIGDNSSYAKNININNSYVVTRDFGNRLLGSQSISIIDKDKINTFDKDNIVSGTDFIIDGKGFGHGVGMSQWGAYGMAKEGYNFEEILKYYYTGVEINRIY